MIASNDVGRMIAVFKRNPEEHELYTNEVIDWLMLAGEVVTPDGLMEVCYDYRGYEWRIPAREIKNDDGEYGWTTKCYSRILEGFEERR